MTMRNVLTTLLGVFLCASASTQILINEVQTANMTTLPDFEGSYTDWFELYNAGTAAQSLSGFSVTDDPENPDQWGLPPLVMQPGEHLIIRASGKDLGGGTGHYETAVMAGDTWKYLVPVTEPDAAWKTIGFNDGAWLSGPGGFGFADGDDGTTIAQATSVYSRKTFTLSEASNITELFLHVDYDDAFVAYLNGVEIARANIGFIGVPPAFSTLANGGHEANQYQGIPVDMFTIDPSVWQGLLTDGENVLALQVHNVDPGSSDLTGNGWLSFFIESTTVQFSAPPAWMNLGGVAELHTNFGLSIGETLYLSNAGVVMDQILIPQTSLEHSYCRETSGSPNWCFATIPTPGAQNSNVICATAYEPKPVFNIQSGLYSTAQNITLTSLSPDADIRYTTDGSVPTESSTLYTGPITLTVTTVLSARCFSNSGLLPSHTEKNTYMIDESYLSVPVICISTNPDNLWDENIGIYVFGPPDYDPGVPYFGANFWEDWERESYIEYYDWDGELAFEGPVGLKIHGGWSRVNDQKSFRIVCRDDYGMDEIEYPLISDKPWINDYKSFNLRNGGNEYWGPRYHDALMQRAMRSTEADYMGYAPVVTFLNGEYWGWYELRENLDENFCEDNEGVPADDATVISYNYMGFNVINGTDESFFEMYNWVMAADNQSEDFFEQFGEYMDIENYVDYIIAETYYMNGDWSSGYMNNTKFWKDEREGGKWRFMLMDLDFGMGDWVCNDYIYRAGDDPFYTDQIFAKAIANPEFREYFILRYFDLVNTVYQTENFAAIREQMRSESEDAMIRHCQRWGSDYNWWYNGYDGRLNWNDQRLDCIVSVLQNHFGLNNSVEVTLDVVPAGAGRIHISTVEPSESEYPWTGTYINGIPVRITAIANPGYQFEYWSPNSFFPVEVNNRDIYLNIEQNETFVAHFSGEAVSNAYEVSEFMYNPSDEYSTGDWVEIHNKLDYPLDISSMIFRDGKYYNDYRIPVNTVIPADGYYVLAEDPADFSLMYPEVELMNGGWRFGLNNSGDDIEIFRYDDVLLSTFSFDDMAPWPVESDGTGRSVEFTEGETDQNDASNWFTGCIGGSPGAPYDPNCGTVSVQEESVSWLTVYPNPNNGQFTIEYHDTYVPGYVVIRDMTGRVVHRELRTPARSQQFDLTGVSRGVYTLEVSGEAGTEVFKMSIR